MYTVAISNDNSIYTITYNTAQINKWKLLFEVNFIQSSTKAIRLLTLDFYGITVDLAFGIIHCHLIEIENKIKTLIVYSYVDNKKQLNALMLCC